MKCPDCGKDVGTNQSGPTPARFLNAHGDASEQRTCPGSGAPVKGAT